MHIYLLVLVGSFCFEMTMHEIFRIPLLDEALSASADESDLHNEDVGSKPNIVFVTWFSKADE